MCPGFIKTHDRKYFCCGLWMKSANDSNAYCNFRFSIALLTIYVICCSVKFLLYAELSQNLQMQDLRSQMTVTPSPNPPSESTADAGYNLGDLKKKSRLVNKATVERVLFKSCKVAELGPGKLRGLH